MRLGIDFAPSFIPTPSCHKELLWLDVTVSSHWQWQRWLVLLSAFLTMDMAMNLTHPGLPQMPIAPRSSSQPCGKISSGLNSEDQGQPSPHNAVPLAPRRSTGNRSFHSFLYPRSEHMNWQLTWQKWPREAVYTIHRLLSEHVKIGVFIGKNYFRQKLTFLSVKQRIRH